MEKLRVFEAFAGYGSQSMALERLGIDFEVVGISEIDKYAIQAYMAVHGDTENYGDISKIDWEKVPDFDFFTYSFPCQDISSAGEQRGLEEGSGTRSSLLWECKKAIEAKKPKYLLMENVKALTSKKFKPYLNKWTGYLENLGYTCYTKVLNSKNFGVPQNRERTFMVSILGDESFFFPEEFPLEKRLKDVLEKNVDEKYYLSEEVTGRFKQITGSDNIVGTTKPSFRTIGQRDLVYGENGCMGALTATDYKQPKQILEPLAIGYTRDKKGKVVDRHLMDCTNTIHTSSGQGGNTDCYIAEPQVEKIGNIYPSGGQNGNVYDTEGISPTISSGNGIKGNGIGSNNSPKVIEPNVLTPKRTEYGKAVRKEYESGELEESRHNMTEMQPRTDGISNTITTVQKDNLLAEPQIGVSVHPFGRKLEFKGKQSIKTDASPCLRATDYKNPHCVWEIEKNECLRIPQATAKGYIEVEPGGVFDGSYPDSKTRRGRVQEGGRICPTITSQGEPHNVYEGIEYKGKVLKEGDGLYTGTSDDFFRGGLDGISRTIKASVSDAGVVENYRIRKLTPRECFRLMGVSDSDINKIEAAGISRTQQYRMAGNSIVVDVLCHIFRKMFLDKECESKQLYLF